MNKLLADQIKAYVKPPQARLTMVDMDTLSLTTEGREPIKFTLSEGDDIYDVISLVIDQGYEHTLCPRLDRLVVAGDF